MEIKDEKKKNRRAADWIEIGRQTANDYEPGAMRRIQNNRFRQAKRISWVYEYIPTKVRNVLYESL